MRKYLVGVLVGALLAGGTGIYLVTRRPAPERGAPAPIFLDSFREAAKLEAFDVEMHQLVTFEPDPPVPQSVGQAVVAWAKDLVAHERGTAIVFATARYGVDLGRFDEASVQVRGRTVYVALPPVTANVEIDPDRTTVLASTLGAGGETALLARARLELEWNARRDRHLCERARGAAERAIRDLARRLGYDDVVFIQPGKPTNSS